MNDPSQPRFLSPEEADAQSLAGAAYAPDEQERLEKQLQQAIALRQGKMPDYRSPLGAALGGVSHLIDTFSSNHKESALRDQQGQLLTAQKLEAAKRIAQAQQDHEKAQALAQSQAESQQRFLQMMQAQALRGGGGAQAPAAQQPSPGAQPGAMPPWVGP